MYELFTKRLIDLLDERAPVTMVHTVMEQPLGSVENETYTLIHARLDVADEDSPTAEVQVLPVDTQRFTIICDVTVPLTGSANDEEHLIKGAASLHKGIRIFKVEDKLNGGVEYDIHFEYDVRGSENKSELDQIIEEVIEGIVAVLRVGGYRVETIEDIVHS